LEVNTLAIELRKSGISVVGDLPWGTHYCYFYETTQDLLDTLVPFFITGLKNEEFCLWIISNSELLTLEEAKEALGQVLPDLERFLAEGRMEIVTHDEWFQNGEIFDLHNVANRFKEKLDEVLARGYVGMRLSGSPHWLQKKDRGQFREFEEELDKLFPKERIIGSCTYPLATTTGDEIFDVARRHQFALAKRYGQWEVYETPELKQAKAELKRLNEELELRVIERTRELRVANEELRKEITERRQAEENLKQRECQLAEAQRLAHVGSFEWDLGSNTVTWSDELYRIFDVRPEEIDVAQMAISFVHPEDRDLVQSTVNSSVKNREPYSFYYRILRRNGDERIVHSRGYVVSDEDGEPGRVFGATQDVTELKRAEEKLKATTEQLRALSASLESAREEEAIRIAREIHDELGSALTSLKWDLEAMEKIFSASGKRLPAPALRKKMAAILGLTDTTIDIVRRIASELRPSLLDDLGLAAAIEWHARKFQNRTGIIVDCDCPQADVVLSQEQSTAVFRIFQEALRNILRHAQATRVYVIMAEEAGAFVLTIKDNGRGITEEEKSGPLSIGLLGMQERAHLIGGEIEIAGVAGAGTAVTVRLPMVRAEGTFEAGH
jgi:PAS domain S-box-containing protein